jgi:hypothetical protein
MGFKTQIPLLDSKSKMACTPEEQGFVSKKVRLAEVRTLL